MTNKQEKILNWGIVILLIAVFLMAYKGIKKTDVFITPISEKEEQIETKIYYLEPEIDSKG
jgi:hypothetical protein